MDLVSLMNRAASAPGGAMPRAPSLSLGESSAVATSSDSESDDSVAPPPAPRRSTSAAADDSDEGDDSSSDTSGSSDAGPTAPPVFRPPISFGGGGGPLSPPPMRPVLPTAAPSPFAPPRPPAEDEEEKRELLYQIERWKSRGTVIPREVSERDSLATVRTVYERIKSDRKVDKAVQLQEHALKAIILGVETLNGWFNPFDLELDGFSELISDKMENGDFDDVLTEIAERGWVKKAVMQVSPELQLVFMIVSSAVGFHFAKKAAGRAAVPPPPPPPPPPAAPKVVPAAPAAPVRPAARPVRPATSVPPRPVASPPRVASPAASVISDIESVIEEALGAAEVSSSDVAASRRPAPADDLMSSLTVSDTEIRELIDLPVL